MRLLLDVSMEDQPARVWLERLHRLIGAGAAGFRFLEPHRLVAETWREINRGLKSADPETLSLAWTPGLRRPEVVALAGADFDGVFSSLPWWDRRASWFVEENEALRRVAPVIGCPEAPLAPQEGSAAARRQALRLAAATGSGLLVPMDFGAEAELGEALGLIDRIAELGVGGEMRSLTDPGDPVTALVRADAADVRQARNAIVVLINADLSQANPVPVSLDPLTQAAGAAFGGAALVDGAGEPGGALAPGEVRILRLARTRDVTPHWREADRLQAAVKNPRIVIETIAPLIEASRFAAKRIVGDTVTIEADIFADGHDTLVAEVLWRADDERDWRRVPMRHVDNDRWRGDFTPGRIGRHVVTVEAWSDEYRTLAREIEIKHAAGADLALEIADLATLIDRALAHAEDAVLAATRRRIDGLAPAQAVALLLAPATSEAMARIGERRFLARHEPELRLEIDRPQAEFAAWYELFPRSTAPEPGRHGTFDDVILRLPAIREMGFDVLYMPPIHPIGRTNRKGANNSLIARPDDPGSPYAIGGLEGGHDAIHPALGTFDDFRRLVRAAEANGMEIALDFAVQCSPDHPWVTSHPDWFRRRADGSIRFAENPPKKYEDIVNVDFYASAALPDLWLALRDVVLFWREQGVRIFRVDNPHTKPLPFWEWLIDDVRSRHPEVLFLAEAFTKPKMMYRLAKVGFSQSYTYFTWRNTKRELTEYLTELTTEPPKDFFRPHFFVNTPDINPVFLQTSGRPGFLIRAALAATLSGLWGLYSGFELCEATPLPGREEYLDSEKYQIRQRDFAAPGNIVDEITRLNRIRRAHPALQSHLGVKFYQAYNDNILYYGKRRPPHRGMILVAVSLDPHHVQEAMVELPLWEWGLGDDASVEAHDLMRDRRLVWTGKLQRLRFDPADLPFGIWSIEPLSGDRP